MDYYHIEINIFNLIPDDSPARLREIVVVKSPFAAKYLAREYMTCVDVESVEVVNQITGEIIMTCEKGKVVYETEDDAEILVEE